MGFQRSKSRTSAAPARTGDKVSRVPHGADRTKGREKSLQAAISEIERSYGKGAIMRLGAASDLMKEVRGIGTGSLRVRSRSATARE